jgi:uncharacterized protein (DUF1778 family)
MIALRVSSQDRELIEKIVKARGEDLSSFVRRAIRKELASLGFLPIEQKQALGVS